MKTPGIGLFTNVVISCLLSFSAYGQTMIEGFEYGNDADLTLKWTPAASTISVSSYVAPGAAGTNSMRVSRVFGLDAWATENITGPELAAPLVIRSNQYITVRIAGDPMFSNAGYQRFFIYGYDGAGNFGRWGTPVPTDTNWHVVNISVATIEKPWDSTALPDLSNITKFKIVIYGQGETPATEYTAIVHVDDITLRDKPLTVPETLIDAFEYANDPALKVEWTAGAATIGMSSYVEAGVGSTKSMSVTRTFPAALWEAETISAKPRQSTAAISDGQFICLRIAGDPQFAKGSYNRLFVYAYDTSGNFGRWGGPVPTSTNWHVLNMRVSAIEKPWDSPALPDLNNIKQFKLMIFGQGEPAGEAFSATIHIDELAVRNTPLIAPMTVIENFEYASDADMALKWSGGNSTLALSPYVAARSTGTNSLQIDRFFGAAAWNTEIITRVALDAPLAIAPTQYLTIRIAGDPQFTNATFNTLFIYAWDSKGLFGRWGSPVPASTNWEIFNFRANTIALPWDSAGLPDLNDIVQFRIYVYGQGDPPGPEYPATFFVDDFMVRSTALIEFPAPSAPRTLIENFETYADNAALTEFYTTVNSPAATLTTPTLETPAPQGSKALKLAIDFSSGQYPWGSVRSKKVAPFSFPTNGVVNFRFKGDPALAPVLDAGTSFWITFYDDGGRSINYNGLNQGVSVGEWQTMTAHYNQFWSGSPTDTGNIVQWRLLVQGWTGSAASTAMSGAFYVDDIWIGVPPVLNLALGTGNNKQLEMTGLIPGTEYTLRESPDLVNWTSTKITPTASTYVLPIPAGNKGFYQLYYVPQ